MSISLTLNSSTPDEMLSDLQRLFPALVAGTGLPPMQEQPRENREPLPESNVKEIVNTRGTRRTKPKEEAKADAGEPAAPAALAAETAGSGEPSPSTEGAAEVAPKSADGEKADAIPDIEDLRARLKTLGATEGFGTDKVFEVLGKYGAKNASTVPEDKRAACIAEIDDLLKAAAK